MHTSNEAWAMVVGGTSGIGYSVDKQLLESGVNTLIVGNDPEKLKQATEELARHGETEPLQANLYDPSGIKHVVAAANDHGRHI